MLSVPDDVRCAVCKSIFCCLDCRSRHEANAHSQNDVWTERNRMQCGFCKGSPTMEFHNRNDFALIMHLCQSHLPLHCKKCSTQFNTIGDFTMENKCVHVNDGCDLQPTKTDCCNTIEKSSASDKELTNIGYVTANSLVQKSTLERSISDSVVSLKNYSTILHNSNNTLYKTQSPNSVAKTLERQTSTPMHQNLLVFKSPETNGCCASCSISSSSSQISSIHSSSESDTSPQAIMESNETRHDLHQQSIVVTQKKTTTFKRSKQSLTMTPLTRQVMTKSIHRAILEYQQCGTVLSPRSPLDLRTSLVIRRDVKDSPEITSNSTDPKANLKLATVYEQTKDDADDENDSDENKIMDVIPHSVEAIKETPIPVSRKLSTEKNSGSDGEVWFTPKEPSPRKAIETNDGIYTPKVSKKRTTAQLMDQENINPMQTPKEEPKKPPSKLWSFVSTILRFASLTPVTDTAIESKISMNNSVESPAVIKRCASMADVLREKNSDDDEMDPSNGSLPIKRRRITSMHSSIEEEKTVTYTRRIQCRRPIRRMQDTL